MLLKVYPVPSNATLKNHQLEVVSRYRDPQLQVGNKLSYLFIFRPIFANVKFKDISFPKIAIKRLIKRIKTDQDYCRAYRCKI